MLKRILIATLLVSILFVICGCESPKPYDPNDFIGLTSTQIIEKFGRFDQLTMPASPDGLYRNCGCGYIVTPAQKGYLGTTPPELFVIYFDENGIAYECNYETGGWGG